MTSTSFSSVQFEQLPSASSSSGPLSPSPSFVSDGDELSADVSLAPSSAKAPTTFHVARRPAKAAAAGKPSLGYGIGSTVYKLDLDPTADTAFSSAFARFKAELTAHKGPVEDVGIYLSRGYISYKIPGHAMPRTLLISEAETFSPVIQKQIKKIRKIAEKAWGSDIASPHYKPGAIAPSSASTANKPVLGSQSDPVLKKKVFPGEKEVVQYVRTHAQPSDENLYVDRVLAARHLRKQLLERVNTRLEVLKKELPRRTDDASRKIIEDNMKALAKLQSELSEDWVRTALPIVVAYKEVYDRLISGHSNITPMKFAERIERELTAHYKASTKPGRFLGKADEVSSFPTDVARQFLATLHADVNDGRADYMEFCRTHGDGSIKDEVFADTFTRYILALTPDIAQDAISADHVTRNTFEAGFNCFIDHYLGSSVTPATKLQLQIQSTPAEHAKVAAARLTTRSLFTELSPPPAPPLHPSRSSSSLSVGVPSHVEDDEPSSYAESVDSLVEED